MDPRRACSFGVAASAYQSGRPGYPAEAAAWALPPGARRVVDLGAGTGKLTATLLDLGLQVVAVEPDEQMRALVPGPALGGHAEAIPLADASVDAVLVGQAFHWFDPGLALAEIVRVLRPGGSLGLLWNLFDDDVPWVSAFCDVWNAEARVSIARAAHTPPFDGPAVGLGPPERRLVPHEQPANPDLLALHLRSVSHFILLPEADRELRIRQAVAEAPSGDFSVPYVCDVWRAAKPPSP